MKSKYALALDLGGTKIEAAIIDSQGQVIINKRILTQAQQGQKQILNNIFQVIDQVVLGFDYQFEGLGIAIPGFPDKNGVLVWSGPNIKPVESLNIKEIFESKYKLPVRLDNDANCFALAEAVFGAGKDYDTVCGIIWGTGIGLGTVIKGKVHSGSIGGAGEFGHLYMPVVNDSKLEYEYLERLASGKHIIRLYQEKGGQLAEPDPAKIYQAISADPIAKEVIDQALNYFGLGISYLVNILNPDIIVLGGGVSNLPEEVYKILQDTVEKFALEPLTKELKISRYQISDSAGLIGAASLVLN